MPSRLRDRQSSLAVWAVRLAMLSVPVLVIAALGHRAEMMDATTTYGVIAVGFSIAALAVIAAVSAFAGIWHDGRKGARTALGGLILGLVILSVPAIGAWRVIAYPRLTDVMTDLDDPPEFQAALAERGNGARPLADPTDDQADLQRDAYPDLVTRQYPVSTARVFADALALVADRGWRILAEHQPDDQDDSGRIEAVAMTPIFGFRQDVVIRIQSSGDGSLVDMRSAARNGAHDLGADAARIRDFFGDLDDSLQGISEQQ
jgi:hypothetical protein